MSKYEIELYWQGRGRPPRYAHTGYGFAMNMPLIIQAKNKASAIKQLKLPKSVKISDIKRVR